MEIQELFRNNIKYTLKEIQKRINCDLETLIKDLKILEERGIIVEIDNFYQKLPESNYTVKELKGLKKGYGVFYLNEQRYTIHKSDLNGALNNDLCLFVYDKVSKQAKVKKIIKRANDLIVAEMRNGILKICGQNVDYKLFVPSNETRKLVDGHRVLIRLNNECGNLKGNIVEIIGHKDDPDIDLKQIALSKNFALNFSDRALEELDSISNEVTKDELEGRLDLRDDLIYTIDCDHTKDIDDAISISLNERGNFVLGVHIADVSHYVKYGSALFQEAYSRGTSVYMLGSAIPMLPKYLSNGICSLNPNVDRLTKSCIMEINQNGEVVDYKIIKSVINSKKKMSYSAVNNALEKNIVNHDYLPYLENLKLAQKLSAVLSNANLKRGYIDFQSNDLEVILSEQNKPLNFIIPKQATAEKIIENFMLIANETIANHYCYYPFLYRIHEIPDDDILLKIFGLLRILGYKIPNIKNFDNPKTIQGILRNLINDKNIKIISKFILIGLKKAHYSDKNAGHYALAFDKYTHFTSPIRRICDLIVHNLIDMYDNPNLNLDDLNKLEELLAEAGVHASTKERQAEEAEQEANLMKMAEYMEAHINQYFNGVITNITPSGLFVETTNNITGNVLFSDIRHDFYRFEQESFSMIGKKTKQKLKIGDYVRVKVKDASKEYRTIDFEIVEKLKK